MAPKIQDPFLPPGSLILVTAANGLIASHIVDQLLQYGYAVRGTVRSLDRSAWMKPLFESRHPGSRLDMVEITDIIAPGCYDEALKDVSAVIHTAAINLLTNDSTVIPNSIKLNLNVLEAAEKANASGSKIQRVVLTSSSWAVQFPRPNVPIDVSYDTYDTFAQEALDSPDTPIETKGLFTYVVSKIESEKASWKWIGEHKDAGFALNSVMPATCMGPVLAPQDQPYPSTAGFIRSLYEGKNAELFAWLDPQWFVDVRDAARMHVAAAVLKGLEGERVYAWAERYTWPGVAKVIEETMGEKVPIELQDKGVDMTNPPLEKSVQYLKRLGLEGWEPFEESVRLNIRSFYPQ
ncbi:NAD(P)-binding protein [Pleomassaria siparia CBS 279.74]|uniref:NAD(P)-binding protein n=1 Tax=Pleomassaria siparia CBS 279.74 TaxID=1314801 RepID=A0A6G1KGG1_9PLEO|nr:NAD(P)-binding protein [Pleomassaria siparia CBS 279.74]